MNSKKKAMPVGIEDFGKMITGNYYWIDKTRFIRELLDAHGAVTLITRPRRFGKTLTLSMLQYFFTLEQAGEHRKLFAGLDIEKAGDIYMKEQGSRPVVSLTLKGVQAKDFSGMMENLSELLRKLYGQFTCLENSPTLSVQEKRYFSSILNETSSIEKMKSALSNLPEFLEKHYGKKPILLLDEYDAPILSSWEHGYYDDCIDFMRGFLGNALKTNPSLDFAVLTGVTRISKESIFSGLNNLKVCSVLSDQYSDILGFTQEEAAKLMEDCGFGGNLPELKKWYDGYRFGHTEIYNPWSVIQFVDNGCQFRPYWINSSGNAILKVLLEHVDEERREELEGLMQGIPVEAAVDEGVVYGDIRASSNALYMMMLTTGYLKAVDVDWNPAEGDLAICKLCIPNTEIRMIYRKEILGWMATSSDIIHLQQMLRAMLAGDAKTFQRRLEKLLAGIVSFHDPKQNPENFYHGLMLGFSVLMNDSYRVESNRESGYGRFDIAFFPNREGAPGIILELKAAKSETEMEDLAKEAIRQIEEKSYVTELARQGVKAVWKYGIAFHGKKVWMERG